MQTFTEINHPKVIELLRDGAVGILRTDTLYGIVARADSEAAVARIYQLKNRNEYKSPIVLISSATQLFDEPSAELKVLLSTVWPGKVSVILASINAPSWIRRQNNSVAYRMPNDKNLKQLLDEVGPLVAPSANPEGEPPAMTIDQAQVYFGETVEFYIDGGVVEDDRPSKLIQLNEAGDMERLR